MLVPLGPGALAARGARRAALSAGAGAGRRLSSEQIKELKVCHSAVLEVVGYCGAPPARPAAPPVHETL